jgi:hypothetical protein
MKPINTRILCLALGLALGATSPGCATAYDQCVKPEITAATKLAPDELAKVVSAFLLCGGATSAGMAAPCAVEGLAQLAIAIGPGGEQTVNCLVAYFEKNAATPELKAAAKAVGAKRGVTEGDFHSCNELQMRAPHASEASTGGHAGGSTALSEAPGDVLARGITLASCSVSCGSSDAIAPPSGCMCLRGRGMNARWVALR